MSQIVLNPPAEPLLADGAKPGGWWHADPTSDRIICDLCPRECHLKHGDRGFCFVRENRGGQMVLTTYGRSTGFCIDPIEKKPLNHFLPGTSVLSFGTAGCNLGCKFCQNHDISKAREIELLSEFALPDAIVEAALAHQCASVAFTYNDPVIWAEYAIDTAKACRERGVKAVAVTAGYITPIARQPFFAHFDAANVDLKGFTEEFYQQLTLSHLQPVLDTLQWLKNETDVWFEITNLIIPRANDSPDELRRMCDWLLSTLGDRVPVHFTAFHPDYRLLDRPGTPHETLLMAHEIARTAGLKFVYVGNVHDVQHQSTYCPNCGKLLIERDWYDLGAYHLSGDRCRWCDEPIPGRFVDRPGNWGRRRQPIDISRFSPPGDPDGARTPPARAPVSSTHPIAASALPVSLDSSSAVARNDPADGNPSRSGEPRPGRDSEGIDFTSQQHRSIHALASEVVAAAIQQRATDREHRLGEIADHFVYGAYVSLKRQQRLRSCCGFVNQRTPLHTAIVEAATRTASHDVRLPPISVSELPYLELETWLLDKTQPVLATGRDRVNAVEVGRHGLLIIQGTQRGLLLPGVAVEHEYDAEMFLAQVCRKAGIRSDAWLSDDTQLFVFEATSYRAPLDPRSYREGSVDSPVLYTSEQLAQLQDWVSSNFLHALRGSTPNYYLPTLPDAMVQLASLSVTQGAGEDRATVCRVSLRPAMPLQATLCQLAEMAAESLANQGRSIDDVVGPVDLTIGHDSAMHHTLADPDLSGFDPTRRGLFATNRQSWAVAYRPQDSAEAVVAELHSRIGEPTLVEQTQVYSLLVQSTLTPYGFGSRPASIRASEDRAPAVAGRFYPAEPEALQRALTELFRGLPNRPRRRPCAVMVPHAGWMYSGRLAAEVLAGVEIPDRVIVIGPKHTSAGVDYAVAPHRVWKLPGMELENDRELAQQLIRRIPSWEWDAAAHLAEHAIEVELPLLHQLAPACRVVGIALGLASWEKCQEFAAGLATLLRECSDVPLLVISSDMNHFATDDENRRLDEFALQALESRDPKYAYHAIRERRISMCGLIPAVVVMQALAEIGSLQSVERVNYATSADVTGDRSRVVGYAGLCLFS